MGEQEARRIVRAIIQFWSAGDLPADEAILQVGSMLGVSRADMAARLAAGPMRIRRGRAGPAGEPVR